MQHRESVDHGGGGAATIVPYKIYKFQHTFEDIIFCVDIDRQMEADMKSVGTKGQAFTRLDCIKQAICLFVHSKLAINPNHRFAFARLDQSATWWQREFTNDLNTINASVRGLAADAVYKHCDLSQLFRMAASEAKKSRAQFRSLRVILIYCRSSVVPEHPSHWPETQKLFNLDVMYLHDKPSRENCPQKVYDALVDALERVSEHEGYIFENGTGLTRVLFRDMCILLSHPQQRCAQDDIDIPKVLKKSIPPGDATSSGTSSRKEDGSSVSSISDLQRHPTQFNDIHETGSEDQHSIMEYLGLGSSDSVVKIFPETYHPNVEFPFCMDYCIVGAPRKNPSTCRNGPPEDEEEEIQNDDTFDHPPEIHKFLSQFLQYKGESEEVLGKHLLKFFSEQLDHRVQKGKIC
ncbi:hypothetical protein KI387_025312 [Taxus chinensis]|uniref:BRISC and BRCA1-A complex member 1 n=1 Tax=Taxus chinensis TaxID=29808 RepID=A0AA38LCI0_TAXCH|nr:hypothetical protein KI387_025312 [Taxus chinensis]